MNAHLTVLTGSRHKRPRTWRGRLVALAPKLARRQTAASDRARIAELERLVQEMAAELDSVSQVMRDAVARAGLDDEPPTGPMPGLRLIQGG